MALQNILNPISNEFDYVDLTGAITNQITAEPTGFSPPGDVVINYDSATRKITLTGTFIAYYRGTVVALLTTGWVSDAHPATLDKQYFLVYNGTTFEWIDLSADAIDMSSDLLIAYVNHGTTYKLAIRESHGLMPWPTHETLHATIGTYKESGGTLAGYTLASTTAADRRPTVSASVLHDEDLPSTVTAFAAAAYSQFFLTITDTVNFTTSAAEIVPVLAARPYWNEFTGGAWQQTLMSNNYHQSIWVLQIPTTADAGSLPYRTVFIQGQSEHLALATVQAEVPTEVSLGGLTTLIPESVFIAKIIIKYSGANWTIVQVDALTGTHISQVSSPTGLYLSAVSTDGSLKGTGTVADPLSALPTTVVKASTDTLTTAEMSGTVVNNYGQAAENTLTLPTIFEGANAIFQVSADGVGALHIKAGPSDKIYLNGTALDDGDKASLATPAVGDMITFVAFQTGASAYDWIARTAVGTWTDGGA